ncbi:MAG: DNRLRE domain-containing protein, partial [Gemmataceae bacterium]|nr:DNRLRE domain-containing protein [Gemmataceae bacterium]
SPTDGGTFTSSEFATATLRPRLSVTYEAPRPGYLRFSEANYNVDESGPNLTVTVVREHGSAGSVTVAYATSDGTATAGQDYTATSGTLTFAAGVTSQTFTVPITNDTTLEPNETFQLALNNPTGGASVGEIPDATATILDNDGPGALQLSAATSTVAENVTGGTITITVSRSGGSGGAVTVAYATSNGSATAGQDYTATSGSLSFAAGETSKTFTIPILDDSVDELNETFRITLTTPTGGATLGNQTSAVVTITDNEPSFMLQQGLNGYAGTQDTEIRAANPDTAGGDAASISVDLQDDDLQTQGLLRYDNLFGSGANQIPTNATILSATLTVVVTSESNGEIRLNRMLVPWNENSTWNSLNATGPGVQFVNEAVLVPDNQPVALPGATGSRSFDVTSSLRAWLASANPNTSNLGWLITNTTNNGWDFVSSEGTTATDRPLLVVVWNTQPLPPAGGPPVDVTDPTDDDVTDVEAALRDSASHFSVSNLPTATGAVLGGTAVQDLRTVPGPDGTSAAVAVLLGETGEESGRVLGGNLGGATAVDTRDEFFQSYGRDGEGVAAVDLAQAFHRRVVVEGRTGADALEGPEAGDGSDWFDVNAFFGSLADRD